MIVEVEHAKIVATLPIEQVKTPLSISWSPDSSKLAVGNNAARVMVFDAKSWSVSVEQAFSGNARKLRWHDDNTTVRVVEEHTELSARMYEWNTSTGEVRQVSSRPIATSHLNPSPDQKLAASSGSDGATYLWDFQTGERCGVLLVAPDKSTHGICPDGRIVSSSQNVADANFVFFLRTANGTELLAPSEFGQRYGALLWPADQKVEVDKELQQ